MGPSSFQKIKLLGRGDVGKVFLVREKKSSKLFAMKGARTSFILVRPLNLVLLTCPIVSVLTCVQSLASAIEERNDPAEENQTRVDGAGHSGYREPSVHRDTASLIPVGRVPLFLHGILHGRRILPCTAVATRQMPPGGCSAILRRRGRRGVRVSAPDGFHLPRPEARECV